MVRFLLGFLFACAIAPAQTTLGWKLVWADEFSGAANSPPGPTKWGHDTGNGSPDNPGWGNDEKEVYFKLNAPSFMADATMAMHGFRFGGRPRLPVKQTLYCLLILTAGLHVQGLSATEATPLAGTVKVNPGLS